MNIATTPTYAPVKRFTKVTKWGAADAARILERECDWLKVVEQPFSGNEWRYAIEWTSEEDGEVSYFPVYILRNGDSFVAIPSEYYGEGTEFTATNGDDVRLGDDGNCNLAGFIVEYY